jgi:nucleotide-binding universal stress UspA family protein
MSFQHLLVPVDFSETSLHALRLAVRLARHGKGRITLLHVGATAAEMASWSAAVPEIMLSWHADMSAEQKHALERIAREEVPEDVAVTCEVREGWAAGTILDVAKEVRADAICLGTHGRTGVERVLLGSVAERVVRGARVPVITTH